MLTLSPAQWGLLVVAVAIVIVLPFSTLRCHVVGRLGSAVVMLLCAALIPRYGIAAALLLFFAMAPCVAVELRGPTRPTVPVDRVEEFANQSDDAETKTKKHDDDDNDSQAASADAFVSASSSKESAKDAFINQVAGFSNLTERREQFRNKVGRINEEIRGLQRFYNTLSTRPKDAKQHYNFINH